MSLLSTGASHVSSITHWRSSSSATSDSTTSCKYDDYMFSRIGHGYRQKMILKRNKYDSIFRNIQTPSTKLATWAIRITKNGRHGEWRALANICWHLWMTGFSHWKIVWLRQRPSYFSHFGAHHLPCPLDQAWPWPFCSTLSGRVFELYLRVFSSMCLYVQLDF